MILSPRFEQALVYAATIHSGQTRTASHVPYIAHLLAVTSLVLENGANEDVAIAALLHDAAEDAGGQGRLSDIRTRFGAAVADMIADCTDAYETPKPPWRARKEAYIAHLPRASRGAILISCCDKLHNTRAIVADLREHGEETWKHFQGGRDGSLWYYHTLVPAYARIHLPSGLVDELKRTVELMETLAGGAT